MQIYLSHYGYRAELKQLQAQLGSNYIEMLNKLIVMTSFFEMKRNVHMQRALYKIDKDKQYIFFARFCGIMDLLDHYGVKYKVFKVKARLGSDIEFTENITLEDHQQQCFDWLVLNIYNEQNLINHVASCVFVMDTGFGKSYIALKLISHFHKRTLIVVPNTSNVTDWEAYAQDGLGIELGYYCMKRKEIKDITIMTIHAATDTKYKLDDQEVGWAHVFNMFDLIIIDEIHDCCTEIREELFWRSSNKICIGLTATPNERKDRMDIIAQKHIGKIVDAKQIIGSEFFKTNWHCDVNVIKYRCALKDYKQIHKNSNGQMDFLKTNKMIAEDPTRRSMAIDILCGLTNRYVYVFGEYVESLECLYNDLIKRVDPDIVMMFTGKTDDDEKLRCKLDTVRIILVTYSYGQQGKSIDRMDTLMLYQPRKSKIRQLIGRIFRGNPSELRLIYDLVDMDVGLYKQYLHRKSIYAEKLFKIIED
jgi:superfamily II DNA or RNA helicase